MAEKKEVEGVVEFIAIEPVKHNGMDYQVGDAITLTEKEAIVLLGLEVVKKAE